MHFLISPARRGFLNAAVGSAILLTLIGSLSADDQAPRQFLGGKAAVRSRGASRYYDGRGRFAGRSSTSGSTTRLYDSRGRMTGWVEVSKDSTRIYDRSGSFAGRSTGSGKDTRFYDAKGAFDGHSTKSGNTTRFYDRRGAYSGRAELDSCRFFGFRGGEPPRCNGG
jgi:YD repeat-containing protein